MSEHYIRRLYDQLDMLEQQRQHAIAPMMKHLCSLHCLLMPEITIGPDGVQYRFTPENQAMLDKCQEFIHQANESFRPKYEEIWKRIHQFSGEMI